MTSLIVILTVRSSRQQRHPYVSWPANAGHPGETCADAAISGDVFFVNPNGCRYHLGGPHLRAMTVGGGEVKDHTGNTFR
jgi:hypothetical protein